MADNNQEQIPRGSTFALVAVIAAALLASLSLTRPVADSSRSETRASVSGDDGSDVAARLWRDPLEVVPEVVKPLPPETDIGRLSRVLPAQVDRLVSAMKEGVAVVPSGQAAPTEPATPPEQYATAQQAATTEQLKRPSVHMLAVLLPSGDTSEDKERRLRARRAVLAALHRWGYEPDDPNYLRPRPLSFGIGTDRVASTAKAARPVRVATESFSHRSEDEARSASLRKTKVLPGDQTEGKSRAVVRLYWLSDKLLHPDRPQHYSALLSPSAKLDMAPRGPWWHGISPRSW
jgi:hypothetical protein